MKILLKKIIPILDILLSPFTLIATIIMFVIRRSGVHRFKIAKQIFLKVGVFPIRDHYYEPLFNEKHLKHELSKNRDLPGINWNDKEQLELLSSFNFNHEMSHWSNIKKDELTFHFGNRAFESGDAEYWYNTIRHFRPKKIIEIGSGHSTKIAKLGIDNNKLQDSNYLCEHTCIEPYEMPWLEKIGAKIIRKRVEDVDTSFFKQLNENDILFIDSSHMVRPQGDVTTEFLQILPTLNKGVIVHVHDIFSPKDYPREWLINEVRLWNEQYILEAFLTSNSDWKIIGSLNYLHHQHYSSIQAKCPFLTKEREPGSFYMQKVN